MSHLTTAARPDPRLRRQGRAAPWAVWALLPTAVTLLAFNYWPLVRTAVLSFQSSDLFGRPSGYVGLDNYSTMLGSADFRRTLVITFTFVGLSVVAKLAVGMALAVPLAARLRGTGFSRAIVLIPMAVSAAVAGLAFRALMSPTYGLLDQIAIGLTGQPAGWITDPTMAMVSIIVVDVWTSIGFVTLLLIAAIDAVPPEVDEAAAIDGASRARTLASITVPLITPTLFFIVVTQSIQAMREFTIIQVVTGGGPARSTQTLVFDIWAKAFSGTADYGAASARGIILLVIIAALTAVQFGILERKVSY